MFPQKIQNKKMKVLSGPRGSMELSGLDNFASLKIRPFAMPHPFLTGFYELIQD
jgi:hypothetical protein